MTDDYFWKNIRKRTNVGSERDKQKETVPLTQHEEKLFSRLCSQSVIDDGNYALEEEGYDDDDISVVSSCMGDEEGHENIELEEFETADSPNDLERWKELTESEKVSSAADGLKNLGNAKR